MKPTMNRFILLRQNCTGDSFCITLVRYNKNEIFRIFFENRQNFSYVLDSLAVSISPTRVRKKFVANLGKVGQGSCRPPGGRSAIADGNPVSGGPCRLSPTQSPGGRLPTFCNKIFTHPPTTHDTGVYTGIAPTIFLEYNENAV